MRIHLLSSFHRMRGCGGAQGGRKANLTDVCYKPFGRDCATQSLLQYWQMSREVYEKGDPRQHGRLSPEYCLSHWSTACLAAYGGPQANPRAARCETAGPCITVLIRSTPQHLWAAHFETCPCGRWARVQA